MPTRIHHQNDNTMDTNANNISETIIPLIPDKAFFGRVVYQPGSVFGPRIQDGLQLVGIEEGHVNIAINGKRHELEKDSMCLLLPGQQELFRFAKRQATRHNWCTMSFGKITKQFNERLRGLPFAVPMTPLMHSLMEWGLQAHANPLPSSQQLSIHLGQSLFYAWLGAMSQTTQRHPNPTAVELARAYIAQRYARPIVLDDLADAANVSANHLNRLFNEHLNITPSRYLWKYRTQRGVDLLRHTGLSVSQIAERVGFTTPFHFSRLVKQMHNVSPRQLREQLWKQP